MFASKIAIVTGAGSGIGQAVCKRLANESASIVAVDKNLKNVEETVSSLNGKHVPLEVDVSKLDSVKTIFDKIINVYGKDSVATLLVNCAGITRDGWMVSMSEQDFDDVLNVNLKGTFLTTKLACNFMIESKVDGGSVVNVTSVSAKIGNIGQANYVASKAAVEGFTRTVAREMGKYNIRCNAVMPGFIETPMIETVPDKGEC